jgi:3-isopropylmalate/(R)-2-methylmalate dehydratase large subunit
MAKNTLYNKIWQKHLVAKLPTGQDQIFIDRHLMHEVTSPPAFSMLKEDKANVLFPERTFATIDHIIPTDNPARPYADPQAELMAQTIEKNTKENSITFFDPASHKQGVIHVVMAERGLIHPGMTVACGDSHTSTHGAFGALAFGIGTTQVKDILETQSLALSELKVRKIEVVGKLSPGVAAKDIILKIIQTLGVNGGIGYAYEFGGNAITALNMEERLTICNMAIEGGARIGYINPDETTFNYLANREYSPKGEAWDKAVSYWKTLASGPDAQYDDVVTLKAENIEPMLTWGINPAQAIGISDKLPEISNFNVTEQKLIAQAYNYMKLNPGTSIKGTPINIVFIGSCTNGRITDLRAAAKILAGKKVASSLKCWVVPGSQEVKKQAEAEGLDKIFLAAGCEWRYAGCSLCLAMNTDKLKGDEISASTSNRNFIGRQGSSTGRTILLSPIMAAAAALAGKIVDVRDYLV